MKTKFLLATESSDVIKYWQNKGYEVVFILGKKKVEVVRPNYSSLTSAGRAGAL